MAWRLNAGNETEVMDARGRNVARAHCGGSYGVKLDEAEAHARLIAAAPDLLEALWQIVTDAEIDCDTEEAALAALADIRVTARAAIAKAKGEA
jgi:hypothetical protein